MESPKPLDIPIFQIMISLTDLVHINHDGQALEKGIASQCEEIQPFFKRKVYLCQTKQR